MSASMVLHRHAGSWRDLYRAALFETDRNKLAQRIASAEKAIVARGRHYALRALQSCLRLKT
jgi:hypothetical protein